MAGRKRMLYGHAGWSPDKHLKHEWPGVNPTNAMNVFIDSVPYPPLAKKSHKAYDLCEHQRQRSNCKNCNGSSISEHQRRRSRCKDYGGSSLCEHQRQWSRCKDCDGSSICEHQRVRSRCCLAGSFSSSLLVCICLHSSISYARHMHA